MEQTKRLGEEKISKLLISFSLPAITGMVVNALYNVVDRIFIGNGVGALALAGVTVAFPLMLVMLAFAMLIGLGATSLISLKLGEQKKGEAELILGNGVVLLTAISLVITVIGLLFLDLLLKLFGTSEAVIPYAREYTRIILWGTIFQSLSFGMNGFIRAEGNPKTAMLTMLIGAVLNVILNPLFIFVFHWGIAGSAYATVLSQLVSMLWMFYYFQGGKSLLKLQIQNFKLDFALTGNILAMGFAPFAMQMAASLVSLTINQSLSLYGGDLALSAMGIIISIATLILMPIFGINQGVQPIIGFNYGAQKFDRVKEALKLAILTATAIVCLGFVVIQLFSLQLMILFNQDDRQLIQFGSYALRIFLIFLPVIGFQIVGSSYFQAVGKPKQAIFLGLVRQLLILIPAILILPKFFGLDGVLMASPTADLVSCLLTIACLLKEFAQLDKKREENYLSQAVS